MFLICFERQTFFAFLSPFILGDKTSKALNFSWSFMYTLKKRNKNTPTYYKAFSQVRQTRPIISHYSGNLA